MRGAGLSKYVLEYLFKCLKKGGGAYKGYMHGLIPQHIILHSIIMKLNYHSYLKCNSDGINNKQITLLKDY